MKVFMDLEDKLMDTNIFETKVLITPKELMKEISVRGEIVNNIDTYRKSIRGILDGEDSRFLIVVGPCSIHNVEEALKIRVDGI